MKISKMAKAYIAHGIRGGGGRKNCKEYTQLN